VKPESKIEEAIKTELASWDAKPSISTITLDALRSSASKVSEAELKATKQEIASLFPMAKNNNPKPRPKWLSYAAGLVAACVLFAVTPTIARGAADLPLIGPYIQQIAFRHVGLGWAFEHGYMQGTIAQVSKDGVTLKILGVVADPVETTVIYLLQGIDEATTENEGAIVHITSVDGNGVVSWTNGGLARTSLGIIGTTHTRALANPTGIISIQTKLPQGDTMALSVSVSREEISKLSQEFPQVHEQVIDGITVKTTKAVLTPSQLMIDYTMNGGHGVWGATPREYRIHLSAGGENYTQADGSGGYLDSVTNTWHLQAIFARPKTFEDIKLVIPALSTTVDTSLEWSLEQARATATNGDYSMELFDISVEEGLVSFRYLPSLTVWAPRGLSVTYADGNEEQIERPNAIWRGDGITPPGWSGFELELTSGSTPIRLRASALEVIVSGPWTLPITLK